MTRRLIVTKTKLNYSLYWIFLILPVLNHKWEGSPPNLLEYNHRWNCKVLGLAKTTKETNLATIWPSYQIYMSNYHTNKHQQVNSFQSVREFTQIITEMKVSQPWISPHVTSLISVFFSLIWMERYPLLHPNTSAQWSRWYDTTLRTRPCVNACRVSVFVFECVSLSVCLCVAVSGYVGVCLCDSVRLCP